MTIGDDFIIPLNRVNQIIDRTYVLLYNWDADLWSILMSLLSLPADRLAPSTIVEKLNLAAACLQTRALGPGLRSVIWVQGCPFHCPGCLAPEWAVQRPARLVTVDDLADWLLTAPQVSGLTISGGEPMLQANALARLVGLVRRNREIDIICFTGYRLDVLQKTPPNEGVAALLSQVDLLIDGPYIASLNDEKGLRGSSNQVFHYLTERLKGIDFSNLPRRVELHEDEGQALVVGIPTRAMLAVLDCMLPERGEVCNEWT